jgi:DNA-binding HxlR family transcriptional regulator
VGIFHHLYDRLSATIDTKIILLLQVCGTMRESQLQHCAAVSSQKLHFRLQRLAQLGFVNHEDAGWHIVAPLTNSSGSPLGTSAVNSQ